jgi:MoaD family protein
MVMDRQSGVEIRVSVRYYNIVADFVGQREECRPMAAGATIRDLLGELGAESASFQKLAFTDGEQVSGHVRLFRNGQAVLDLDAPLVDGDEMRVFPTISGG